LYILDFADVVYDDWSVADNTFIKCVQAAFAKNINDYTRTTSHEEIVSD